MTGDQEWRNTLVELHVLAESGDPGAADAAARWLERDPAARSAWDEVERDCDRLRSPSGP